MNEVETAPVTEGKHDWVQPRVIRPKKTSAVSYMSESGSRSVPSVPPRAPSERGPFSSGWTGEGSWWVERAPSSQQQEQGGLQLAKV